MMKNILAAIIVMISLTVCAQQESKQISSRKASTDKTATTETTGAANRGAKPVARMKSSSASTPDEPRPVTKEITSKKKADQ